MDLLRLRNIAELGKGETCNREEIDNPATTSTVSASRILNKAESMTIFELQQFVRFSLRLVMREGEAKQRANVIEMVRSLNALKKDGICKNPTRQLFTSVVGLLTPVQLRISWANALSPMALAKAVRSVPNREDSVSPASSFGATSDDSSMSDEDTWTEEKVKALQVDRVTYVTKLFKTSRDQRMPLILRQLFAYLTELCNEEQREMARNSLTQLRKMREDGKLEMMTVELYHAFERIVDPSQMNKAWMMLRNDVEKRGSTESKGKRSAREMEAANELVMLTVRSPKRKPSRKGAQ